MIKIEYIRGWNYADALRRQEDEFSKRIECRKTTRPLPEDLILIAEHNPVYTLGRHGDRSNLLINEEVLRNQGIDVYRIGRGGDITYHGPGQLTVYPIIDLQRYGLGVKQYVKLLEQGVIDTINEYGITGERIEGATGVWIGKGTPLERKISAIGIRCSRFVTMHGLALNVGKNLEGFQRINPCGFTDKGVTSIEKETGRAISIDEVAEIIGKRLISLLQLHTASRGNS